MMGLDLANVREEGTINNKPPPHTTEYYTPTLQPDRIFTFHKLNIRLVSLKGL